MTPPKPLTAKLPMFAAGTIMLEIVVLPNETVGRRCRHSGVDQPSALCRWPIRKRSLPNENVCELIKRGESLHIHSKDFGESPPKNRSTLSKS